MSSSTTNQLFVAASLSGTVDSPANATPARVTQLTRRLAAGDEEGFAEFHSHYFDRLYQFLLVVTRGEEHAAQEALQETFLRVIRYARVFTDEDTFWCWLKRVARTAAQDACRKRSRYQTLLENFASRRQQESPSSNGQDDLHPSLLLAECLEDLDAIDRHLVEGKYLEGATVKELSGELGLSEKSVESRLVRLRRRLREQLLQKLHSR